MQKTFGGYLRWLGQKLRGHFLAGILIAVPIGVTIWVMVWLFTTIDSFLQPVIQRFLGRPVPGIGFGVTVVLIYLIGAIASNMAGKKLVQWGEYLVGKVPIVRPLYASIKQITESFSAPGKAGFGQTALVEFPRKGIWAVGFITNETLSQSGENWLNIFIPNAPNPTSGVLQIVKEEEVIRTDIHADKAWQMIISAGKVMPREIADILESRGK